MGTEDFQASMYVDGGWHSASGDECVVVNPTDATAIATIRNATSDEVDRALTAAERAFPAWARIPAAERSFYVRAMADVIAAHSEELAESITTEVGKPLDQARGEIAWTVKFVRYVAEWDRRIEGEIVPSDATNEAIHLIRVPLGVVAAILPWNAPVAILFRKIAPAMVTGNTVVVKPSEVAPLSVLRVFQLVDSHVAVPPGVLNVVPGGAAVGHAGVGAAFVSSGAPVVVFVGDGGFGFHGLEFETAVRYGVPLLVVVLDDEKWGAIALPQRKEWGVEVEMGLPRRDWPSFAKALGGRGEFVNTRGEFAHALDTLVTSRSPAVLHIPIRTSESPYIEYFGS